MVLGVGGDTDKFSDKVNKVLVAALKPKRTKSSGDQSIGDIQFDEDMSSILEIVDECLLHRERIPTVLAMARKTVSQTNKSGKANGDEPWSSQYTLWGKIPKYWITSWLGRRYPWVDEKFVADLAKSGGRPKIIRDMFEFETGVKDSMEADPRLHDKSVMAAFLDHLSESGGALEQIPGGVHGKGRFGHLARRRLPV